MVNLNSKVRLNDSNGLSLMINAYKDLIYLYLQCFIIPHKWIPSITNSESEYPSLCFRYSDDTSFLPEEDAPEYPAVQYRLTYQ